MKSPWPGSSWWWSALLTLISLMAVGGAFVLANFGGPMWVFVLLFGWMFTIGLPTFVAAVLTAFFWNGLSLEVFMAAVALAAAVFQLSALRLASRKLSAWRA